MTYVTIIAEFGSSPAPAWDFKLWCKAAQATGADAVKVQVFRADHFPPGHQESKRPLEFPRERLREFVQCAHRYGLTAGASVFDLDAVTLAAQWCDWLKLAAREQDNGQLRDACNLHSHRVYRSITDKWDRYAQWPREITLCAIQSYPAPMIRSLLMLWRWADFNRRCERGAWGWSSHTTGYLDCTLAAHLGTSVIEKHFALLSSDIEAGHSLQPAQFAAMVRSIRKGEK